MRRSERRRGDMGRGGTPLLSQTHLNAIDLLNGSYSRIRKGRALYKHSTVSMQEKNPPHRDAIFGVVESLQSSEVVRQGMITVSGYDRDNHRGRLHFRLLRGSFLREVTLDPGDKGP